LGQVFDLLDEHGSDARILAGGQSLIAVLNLRLSEPAVLIDINPIADLAGITLQDGIVRIGALTRHRDLETSPIIAQHVPLIAAAMPHIAHPAIRTRGTIGGSLALADPAAELPACVVALDAVLVLRGRAGERRVHARDFFRGLYDTALAQGEVLTAIEVPAIRTGERHSFVEIARRHGDYAMAGLAARLRLDGPRCAEARLVYFGVGSAPVAAAGAARVLAGRVLDATAIGAAQEALAADLDPPGDLNGSPAAKLHWARILLGRALAPMSGDGGRI
jgi:carbon-monoxide dehydrogenase medium subunit